MIREVIDIEIDSLQPNPLQPRGIISPESLVDLVDSIKEHGILHPLVVAKTPAGFQIIAGERRWRASKIVGLKVVPVIIKETTPRGMLEMAIVENVQRSDLNPIDRANSFQRLLSEFNLSNAEISQRLGKSPAYISNTLRLLSLPDAIKDGLLTGLITEGHARAISSIEDPKLMVDAYKIILKESASVRRAEELGRKMRLLAGNRPRSTSKNNPHIVNKTIDVIRKKIEDSLGGKSNGNIINLSRSRVETRLTIVLKGNTDDTEERLSRVYKGITGEDIPDYE